MTLCFHDDDEDDGNNDDDGVVVDEFGHEDDANDINGEEKEGGVKALEN
jgi:hypothetical protein